MNFLTKNLEEISKTHPGFEEAAYSLIHSEDEARDRNMQSEEIAIEETASGWPTLLYRGRYLHSRRDPVKEATRLAESQINGDAGCYVIGGFGLGYLTEEVLEGPLRPRYWFLNRTFHCFIKPWKPGI